MQNRRPGADGIRVAGAADLPTINDIYNHYVFHSTCTYQETAEPMESRREWFAGHGARHPVTVAEIDGKIVGWGSLSPTMRGRHIEIRWRIRCIFITNFIGAGSGR